MRADSLLVCERLRSTMIICLGPICFPVWHLLPILVLAFSHIKKWFFKLAGIELPEPADKALEDKKTDGDNASAGPATGNGADKGGAAPEGFRLRANGPGGVTKVTSVEHWQTLQKESAATGRPLVVDFTAGWCKPCKKIAPLFEELSREHRGATFLTVDVDELEEVSGAAGVKAMPTFQAYHGADKLREVTGAIEADLRAMVRATCA